MTKREIIQSAFRKYCTNRYVVKNDNGERKIYLDPKLDAMVKEAYEEGLDEFFLNKEEMSRGEPEYAYKARRDLTVEEYECLTKKRKKPKPQKKEKKLYEWY